MSIFCGFFVASLKPCHGKTYRDKSHDEGKEYNHTYFTFLLRKAISSGYAFQSEKSPFEIENIVILFPLEYSRSIDFWSTILIWYRQYFLSLFELQTKLLTYNRLDIRLVHTNNSFITMKVTIMTLFLVIWNYIFWLWKRLVICSITL